MCARPMHAPSLLPLLALLPTLAAAAVALWCHRRRQGFEPPAPEPVTALVVSMKDGSRPRANVERRLRAAGIRARFVDAVDGRSVTSPRDLAHFLPYKWHDRQWRPAQIGCALSHLRLWKEAEGPALIMEDDARPVPDFAARLRGILREIQGSNVDVVFLGHCFEKRGEPWGHSTTLRTSVLPRCTHAYYVTAGGMRKLRAWAAGARLAIPIDEELALLCKDGTLTCVSAFPQLALQDWQTE